MAPRNSEYTQAGSPPVLGIAEIAEMLAMGKPSVDNIRARAAKARRDALPGTDYKSLFPIPDWVISGNPVWLPKTVRDWAKRTGRLTEGGVPVPAKTGPKPKR